MIKYYCNGGIDGLPPHKKTKMISYDYGQNVHCPICNWGWCNISYACSSAWNKSATKILEEYKEIWKELANK